MKTTNCTQTLKRPTFLLLAWLLAAATAPAGEAWQRAFSKMPLGTNVTELTKTNCIPLMLAAFKPNDSVKALVFMPGATDEFYFFNRCYARLTNDSPTLLDAIAALTNQTLVQVTFRPPMLLVHSAEDALEPLTRIDDEATAKRVRSRRFPKHVLYDDRDWDFLHPILTFELDARILPPPGSHASNHFYRHSMAGWNLDGWEALEAISLAGKTSFIVQRKRILFEADTRYRAKPPVPQFP